MNDIEPDKKKGKKGDRDGKNGASQPAAVSDTKPAPAEAETPDAPTQVALPRFVVVDTVGAEPSVVGELLEFTDTLSLKAMLGGELPAKRRELADAMLAMEALCAAAESKLAQIKDKLARGLKPGDVLPIGGRNFWQSKCRDGAPYGYTLREQRQVKTPVSLDE